MLYLKGGVAELAETFKVLSYLAYGHAGLHGTPYHGAPGALESILCVLGSKTSLKFSKIP